MKLINAVQIAFSVNINTPTVFFDKLSDLGIFANSTFTSGNVNINNTFCETLVPACKFIIIVKYELTFPNKIVKYFSFIILKNLNV